VRGLNSTEANALAGTEGASYPFWSPDGRFVGYFAGNKLKKIAASGGIPTTLSDVNLGTGGSWSRDGVILFSSLGGVGLSRVSASGGEVTSVLRPDPRRQESDFTDPSFLPDGSHFLYSKTSTQKEIAGIYLASLDGTVNERVLPDHSNAVYAAAPNGKGYLLFGREGALMAQPFEPSRRQLSDEPFLVVAQMGVTLGNVVSLRHLIFAVSDNGVLVVDQVPHKQRNQLMWVDRGGKKINSLDDLTNAAMLSLSPDGQRFVVPRLDLQTGNNDLWVADLTGKNPTRFTFDTAVDNYPIWSPDGSRIVWCSNREGIYQLYQKAASGAGQDTVLLKSDYYKFPQDWSHDGRYLIYREINPKTKFDIWVLPVGPNAGDQRPFAFLDTEANEAAAVLSPDDRWMAYCSDESGRYEVYVQSFPDKGSKRQISTGGGIGPRWTSKELFYRALDGKLMAVEIKNGQSFEASAPVPLFEFRPGGNLITPYYDVTKDGQKFLLSTIVENEPAAPLTIMVNWTSGLKK
jgi:Tol biopolymer transport system component